MICWRRTGNICLNSGIKESGLMTRFFLGADVGGTKTHVLVADETGQVLGFGEAGPGNHEGVGYDGLGAAIRTASIQALGAAGIAMDQIAGAGFGVGGYDWPSEKEPTQQSIRSVGFRAPIEVVNDTILGILAGAEAGWGLAVVSGTGCNCWGWDRERRRIGQVTGAGTEMGEGAGAIELICEAKKVLAHEWTRRGPPTRLTPAFVKYAGALDLPDLLEGLINDRYTLSSAAAPLIFQTAAEGDPVAVGLIRWAANELGELACAVIRQLEFQDLEFEVVQIGSMFNGSPLLTEVMGQTIRLVAPKARLVPLSTLPVVGAVLLGMEAAGIKASPVIRAALSRSVRQLQVG
jgi:N-acetylglucosamine kinase-like BadF-type ATPase